MCFLRKFRRETRKSSAQTLTVYIFYLRSRRFYYSTGYCSADNYFTGGYYAADYYFTDGYCSTDYYFTGGYCSVDYYFTGGYYAEYYPS